MKTSTTRMERLIASIGSIFLFISFLASVLLDGDSESILELIPLKFYGHPFTSILLPIIHGLGLITSLSCVIKPGMRRMISVLLVESIITILTNYEQLGIFFFYASLILLLIYSNFSKKIFKTFIILFVLHMINITLMFTHGWPKTFVAYFTSIFYCIFFYCIFQYLRSEFCILPVNVKENLIIKSERGSKVSLSNPDFKLSERQINMIYDAVIENLSYKDLSEKYFISISTVKKDFAEAFHVFSVENISELKMLLMQFQIVKD